MKEFLKKHGIIFDIAKYLFSLVLIALAFTSMKSKRFLLAEFLELIIIIALSDLIVKKSKIAGNIVNDILMLFLNSQLIVAFFGNSYIRLVMLTNLDSLEDIGGKAVAYITGVVLVLIFTFLPISPIEYKWMKSEVLLSVFLAAELIFTMCLGNEYSPFYAYVDTAKQAYDAAQIRKAAMSADNITTDYYHESISSFIDNNPALPEKPNVVLILSEGLSQSIVDDPRDIMPTVGEYEKKSIYFKNYYNHAFATYRGIIGQLYSGYQLNNLDTNSLISMEDIFRDHGYKTTMINTEPGNLQYTQYLNELHFDRIVGTSSEGYTGYFGSMTDKEAYNKLFETIEADHSEGNPFFDVIYTFGTHASFDSPDEVFGNGTNAEINKFYNLDCQLKSFMERFEESDMAEDTIIVFTADHATYADQNFVTAFPDYERVHTELDRIPLFMYFKGVEPWEIDVEGRNSLDLAPTVFDYIGIDCENYFLGSTLFMGKNNNNNYDTVFSEGGAYATSDNDSIAPLSQAQQEITLNLINRYYIANQQVPLVPEE